MPPSSPFFSDQELSFILTKLFREGGRSENPVRITAREPNVYSATHPSEIVGCQTSGNKTWKVLCKYYVELPEGEHSHRNDLIYEGKVYDNVLGKTALCTPSFYGTHSDGNRFMLAIEYLENAIRGEHLPQMDTLVKAATWIGRFHAAHEDQAREPLPFLKDYQAGYFTEWLKKTTTFVVNANLDTQYPWLGDLLARYDRLLPCLVDAPRTVVHGEYYPKNILFHKDRICPVDWQSAAVSCGEIDLASLTEGWPPEITHRCVEEYKRTRWPQGEHTNFDLVLLLARLNWNFRWLGQEQEWITDEKFAWRFDLLHRLAERLNII